MADEEVLKLVQLRNEFYRDNFRKIVGAFLFCIIIIIILGAALAYLVTHPPAPRYFATDESGRITPLVALDQPNLPTSTLLQWANVAAVATYTYNFVNYRQELQAASEFYTPEGWQEFLKALDESNNLKAVIAKKLVVSAVATGAPVILQEGVLGDKYSWRVQMPLLVTYQNANQITQQSVLVSMLITRVSTLRSPRGIGIAQFVVTGASTLGE